MAKNDRTSKTSMPVNDAYTGMLTISLLALIGGCVLLYMDYQNYYGVTVPDVSRKPSERIQPAQIAAPAKEPEKEKEAQPGDEKKDKEKEKEKEKEGG